MNLLPWRGRQRHPIDLTDSSDFTLELLDRTWDWRTRLSEEFELGSGEHARVVSSYEIEITRGLIESFPGGSEASRVKALLPVTTRENRPFLNFSIIGPGDSPAHLMRRSAIAAIESEALARYVIGSSVSDLPKLRRGLSDSLLEAICVFMPQVFQEYEAMNPRSFERALAEYLTDGLGFPVNRTDVAGWMGPSREAGDILREALDEPEMRHSSAELILLAIPRMDPLPHSVHEIGRVVAGFRDSIQMAHEAGDIDLLSVLAEYGRRWEVIIETEVPIDEPATIRLIEDRPLGLGPSGWIEQVVSLGDAPSANAQVRVLDNTVRIKGFSLHTLDGETIGIPVLEAVRDTTEGFSLYTAMPEPDRPYYIRVRVHLQTLSYMRWTGWLVAAIGGLATLAALFVDDGNNLADNLALLAVPTTFAVALVLVREQTALSVRLQMTARTITIIVAALLWVVVFSRLIASGIDYHWLQTLADYLQNLASSVRTRLGLSPR